LRKSWQHWLAKRFQFEQRKKLSQRDVLVFIYQQGYLYLVLILITFVAGINYANNLVLAFCFLISAILCISFYLTFKQLHGLEIEIDADDLGQVGQPLHLQLSLKQLSPQRRYLLIETDIDTQTLLMENEKHSIKLTFDPERRGEFKYPIIKIYSVYPFGLVRAWSYLYHHRMAWVAPKADFYQGEQHQQKHSFEPDMDEFRELRTYQLGDSLQSVSWKQAARGQGLYVKVFEQHEQEHHLDIYYDHMPSSLHELRLAYMMGLIEQCEQAKYAYSVHLPKDVLAEGLGIQQLQQAKRLLAQA
jgi:uncharacterized protein (DUF58 family)